MQHVFITGANRGIGLELTRQYLERGERVFAACRQPARAAELHRLVTRFGERVVVVPLELADAKSIESSAQIVQAYTDALDILFNNAASNPKGNVQSLGTYDPNVLFNIMQVNVVAPMLVTQAYVDLLSAGSNPRLINLSSEMGSLELHDYSSEDGYSISKAAINMLTRCLAARLARQRIIVISLDPGWVKTDMGGQHATLRPEESVKGILRVVDGLTAKSSGDYLRWNGSRLPW